MTLNQDGSGSISGLCICGFPDCHPEGGCSGPAGSDGYCAMCYLRHVVICDGPGDPDCPECQRKAEAVG